MISQYEANRLLKEMMPEMAMAPRPSRVSLEIYTTVIYFADYTKRALTNLDSMALKRCFAMAEYLCLHGEKIVRLLIEDSFVFSVSSVISHGKANMGLLRSVMPETLFNLYCKHTVVID